MTQIATPLIQARAAADAWPALGGSIAVRLRSAHTAGRLGLVELEIPPGFGGLPLHVHPAFDEVFYVVEGELTYRVGHQVEAAGAGAVVVAPGDVPHTFAELQGRPARLLLLAAPGGHERYFEQLAQAIVGGAALDAALYDRLMREHGIEAVGSADPHAALPPG